MIQTVHAICYFEGDAKKRVLQLMRDQSSCARAAYQARIKKTAKNINELRANLISRYGKRLKVIQIYDAITRTDNLKKPGVVFGSRKSWSELNKGKLVKEEWSNKRDLRFYASGDKRLKGNRSIRFDLETKEIFISSGSSFRKYIKGKFWASKRQLEKLELTNYRVQLKYVSGNKFEADTCFGSADPETTSDLFNGFIGMDTNPDGLGVSETDKYGNLLFHSYMQCDRLKFASTDKRLNDSRLLAKYVVDLALRVNKPIAIEQLSFGRIKSQGRKFNRMRANFVYSELIEAIKSRAVRNGVLVKEVNPAYTSKLGKLKYKKMFSLSDHEAAALVIARRAMGFNERKDFSASLIEQKLSKVFGKSVKPRKVAKTNLTYKTSKVTPRRRTQKPNLEQVRLVGRGFSVMVKGSSWLWLQRYLKSYPSSQDPLRHQVKDPAYSNLLGVKSASNRENCDSQQVDHVTNSISNLCKEMK